MNIGVVGPSKRFFSGLSAHTICLANAMSKHNKVSVALLRNLLPRFLYPGKGHLDRQDYSLNFLPGIETYHGLDWNSPPSWAGAYRFLKQQKTDVIVMQWWTSSVAHMQLFLAITNTLKIKSKLILEMHEIVDPLEESILPIRLYSRIMGRLLMSRVDAFVVHSNSVKHQVARIYHLSDSSIFVIPFGLYDAYYRHIDKQEAIDKLGIKERFVILYFGLIRKYKGVPYLVEAFNKLPQDIAQHSRLVIAGEDWGDETSLGDMINSAPYKERISYKPQFIPDDMIPRYFSAADVVVLPYLRTAGSAVANIAMAYGKPIITSDLETMRECLADYKGARFAPVGDSATIAERLLEIYAQHKSGELMVYNPPRSTWDEVARQYKEIIEQLCKNE
jgi:glycosyltransferase involved in cell wall biosynthesis